MFKNYLFIATRVFLKQKTYSSINILGLSIGLASSLLIFVYILDELSYDRFITDADRIYRVGVTEKFQGQEVIYTVTGAPYRLKGKKIDPRNRTKTHFFKFNISIQI